MEYAYHIKKQRMVSLQEATYSGFYSGFECPECHQILHLRKGKRPCFAHERTQGECKKRVSWEQRPSIPNSIPEARYQHYWLLRARLLDILIDYHINGQNSILDLPKKNTIQFHLVSKESSNILLLISSPYMQARILKKINHLAQRKRQTRENKQKKHYLYVWDILRVFLLNSEHFSALQALDILASANNGYPKIPSDLRDCLNEESVDTIVKACHKKETKNPEWESFCDDVVEFLLNTFYYIDWKKILVEWEKANPAVGLN